MKAEVRKMYQLNQVRNLALGLIAKGHKISKTRATAIEQEAWKYQDKYALLIRRIVSGMSVEEALIDLEPIEKEEAEEIVAEGDLQCGKCKSKRIHRVEKQTRSADESATVFCHCSVCGHR